MSTVITGENLGEKYTLHHQQREQYIVLRDVIADGFKGIGRRFAPLFSQSQSPKSEGEGVEPAGGRGRRSPGTDRTGVC